MLSLLSGVEACVHSSFGTKLTAFFIWKDVSTEDTQRDRIAKSFISKKKKNHIQQLEKVSNLLNKR